MRISRISCLRFSSLVLAAVSLPALGAAQRSGGAAGAAPAAHAAPVAHVGAVMHAPSAAHIPATTQGHATFASAPRALARTSRGSGNVNTGRFAVNGRMHTGIRHPRHVNNNGVNFAGSGETNFDNVPGLGFDFPHLAAVTGNDHFGEGFIGGAPFFDGGFLFGAPSVIIEQPGETQPEAEDVIAGNSVETHPMRHSRRVFEAQPDPGPADAAPEEVAQYVFVKRDGGLEFAVAYSWVDGNLRYITPDGKRRTLGRDALDLQATEQFNEERGIQFHAPA
jgi:hypothetical protein